MPGISPATGDLVTESRKKDAPQPVDRIDLVELGQPATRSANPGPRLCQAEEPLRIAGHMLL
jgi:hypothetical protein